MKSIKQHGEVYIPITIQENLHLVDNHSLFYTIESYINKFILYSQAGNKEAIYSILDKEYIVKNDITKDTVLDYVQNIKDKDTKLIIRKMYVKETEKNEIYYVYSLLEKDHTGNQVFFKVYKDKTNATCSISLMDIDEFNQVIKNKKEIAEKEIQKNEYNTIKTSILTDEQKATRIFEFFIHSEIYYTDYAYNELLNDDYKQAIFGSLEEYKKYINRNYDNLTSMDISSIKKEEDFKKEEEYNEYLRNLKRNRLDKYSIERNDNYTRYTIMDTLGNLYIFDETEPFNYKVMLDNYTIDFPEFIAKYNGATLQEKVAINIQKFINAIEDKSYYYAYNCLAESFRNNYFKTEQDFENYAKQNIYEQNKIQYKNFEQHGDVYTCSVILTNEKTNEQMTKTFIVKLGSGTNFELSFDT